MPLRAPQGFPGGLVVNLPANARDAGPIPGLGRFHGQRRVVGYSPWDHKELAEGDARRPRHPPRSPHRPGKVRPPQAPRALAPRSPSPRATGDISLFVTKFEPRRRGGRGGLGVRGCPFGPRCPLHPLHPRRDGLSRSGGWGPRPEPPRRSARDPRPELPTGISLESPQVPSHLLLCLLRWSPAGPALPTPPSQRPTAEEV